MDWKHIFLLIWCKLFSHCYMHGYYSRKVTAGNWSFRSFSYKAPGGECRYEFHYGRLTHKDEE